MRILTVLVRFGTEQYPAAEEEIAAIFGRQLATADRSVIVVDNALPRGVVQQRRGYSLVGGDNRMFEFSAFDRAIEHVGADIWSYDLIHFATSAFKTLYVAYLERFDDKTLGALGGRPACLGHIDCYNEPVELLNFTSQHWIRSCFFVMPPAEVKALGTFVSIRNGDRFFSGLPEAPFRFDAPLSPTYVRYITDWLTGGDIGQGVEWHSSMALGAATLPSFERKALCIMNEHMLAIRLRALGCRLVDVTWLSTRLSRHASTEVPWGTSWRRQLAGRDRDALHLEASA